MGDTHTTMLSMWQHWFWITGIKMWPLYLLLLAHVTALMASPVGVVDTKLTMPPKKYAPGKGGGYSLEEDKAYPLILDKFAAPLKTNSNGHKVMRITLGQMDMDGGSGPQEDIARIFVTIPPTTTTTTIAAVAIEEVSINKNTENDNISSDTITTSAVDDIRYSTNGGSISDSDAGATTPSTTSESGDVLPIATIPRSSTSSKETPTANDKHGSALEAAPPINTTLDADGGHGASRDELRQREPKEEEEEDDNNNDVIHNLTLHDAASLGTVMNGSGRRSKVLADQVSTKNLLTRSTVEQPDAVAQPTGTAHAGEPMNLSKTPQQFIHFSESDKQELMLTSKNNALIGDQFSLNDLDVGDGSADAVHGRTSNVGLISGICVSIVGVFCATTLVAAMLYRRRYLNKPQTLSEPDSGTYIDDSIIRDNSDEMYSLDNDSFLNSLEAMTIQNYWTDNVKHTKL